MLILPFSVGEETYALDARQVVEVSPLVDLRPVAFGPGHLAGLCNYRGSAVLVFDLCRLFLGRSAARRLSTRILFVRLPDAEGRERILGLLAEGVTEAVRTQARFLGGEGGLLGPVLPGESGTVQIVELDRLLPRLGGPELPSGEELEP